MKTGVVNYEAGNLHSVLNALRFLQEKPVLINRPEQLKQVDRLILPGVGSFGAAIQALKSRQLFSPIQTWLGNNRPYLGICLGLQLLFSGSRESPDIPGFDYFPGLLQRFQVRRVPQIGWNQVWWQKACPLTPEPDNPQFFYFLHSYYIPPEKNRADWVLGLTAYGDISYPTVIQSGNIWGVQFHPEKSGPLGLKLLNNWLEGAGGSNVNQKNNSLPGR